MRIELKRAVASSWLVVLLSAPPARAQEATTVDLHASWSWTELRGVEGVDLEAVAWLEKNLPREEAVSLLRTIGDLSGPEAAQLLPGHFHGDPSFQYLQGLPGVFDRVEAIVRGDLARRPPPGVAGAVQVAYTLARIRNLVVEAHRDLFYYHDEFVGGRLRLELDPAVRTNGIELDLDFTAARIILDILSRPDADEATIARLVDHDAFHALIQHRNQSFYRIALTREGLVHVLTRAAGDSPLDRLYRYAFPTGLLHLAEVRESRDAYRSVLDTLEEHESEIVAHVASAIAPFLPPDVEFTRTVHFLFADGADGWYSGGIAGIDLEFFKDDFDRLVQNLVHETFHSAQTAIRRPAVPPADPRAALFAEVVEGIMREGTASYVAPPFARPDDEARAEAEAGADLLLRIHDVLFRTDDPDLTAARAMRDEGVRGAGPFYWLGREMTATIVDAFGTSAIADVLVEGGPAFVRTYLRAANASGATSLIDPTVAAAL